MISAKLTQYPLTSAANTAAHMVNLATKYAADLGEKAKWPLPKFYRYVRSLEFRSDPVGHESIARPALTMGTDWPWRDCDDKAILLGAWCFANKVPFRFRASSKATNGQLHHVYVMAKIKGRLVPLDATYPRNTLGIEDRGLTAKKDLTGDIMNTLNVFEGDTMRRTNINPELMGSSFLTKVGKVAKKSAKVTVKAAKVAAAPAKAVTHAVLRTPGLKDSLAALVPGGSAALASVRAAAKAGKAATQSSMTETKPTGIYTEMPTQPQGMGSMKKVAIGGGILAALIVAYVATKKRS